MKNSTRMDANTCAWQWRVSCVKNYSRCTERLHHCSKIGFNFNVGFEMRKKLELKLVTNGVILEICDFAKMVNKSKRQFIAHILENNFELGLENEQQRREFTARILHKVKAMMREPPRDTHGVFPLRDMLQCEDTLVDALDADDTEDENQWWSATDEIDESLCLHSIDELKEDVALPTFPYCKGIGLNLEVGSKQCLDPTSLTNGIMIELAHFTRFITSYSSIILGLLEHNFELNIKCQNSKTILWRKILDLLERRKQLVVMLKNESFCLHTELCKKSSAQAKAGDLLYEVRDLSNKRQPKKRALLEASGCGTKRRKDEMNTVVDHTSQAELTRSGDSDHASNSEEKQTSYTCPLDSDDTSDLENLNSLQDSNFDVLRQSESDRSSTVCSSGDEEQARIPGNVREECLVEEADLPVEGNLWRLRANRVKQIFLLGDHKYDAFRKARKIGVQFNIGFFPKQQISVDSLNTLLFFEIAKFALAVNSSWQEFVMEILEYNFDFGFCSAELRKMFADDLMIKVRQLKNRKDSEKSATEIFDLPDLVSLVNVTENIVGNAGGKLEGLLTMKECEVAPVCHPDSQAEDTEENHYPFCEEIGLKLQVNHRQPKRKLELCKLTNGAMSEVADFAERLCGTFEEIFVDILQHNFGFDSQNGNSCLATAIMSRFPAVMEQKNLMNLFLCSSKSRMQWSNKCIWDFEISHNLNAQSDDSVQIPFIDQNVGTSAHAEQENELNLWLWRLRANQVKQILSVPHLEHCPLYSYSKCKKIGIDFNVGSGVKQSLDPKLLTNGIMVELENFVRTLQSARDYFIAEILEYNFDLENFDLKDELSHIAFVKQLGLKVKTAIYRRKYSLMKIPVELPDARAVLWATHPKLKYCPKCYQDRTYMIGRDGSGQTAPQPTKASSSLSPTVLKSIMHTYPRCRLTGLSLNFVDNDQPRAKLNPDILTRGIVWELTGFARKLCGAKYQVVNDIINHNFNLGPQSKNNHAAQFLEKISQATSRPNWFNERFVAHRDSGEPAKEGKKATKSRKALSKSEHVFSDGRGDDDSVSQTQSPSKT